MNNEHFEEKNFGCAICFPTSAEDAWIALNSLAISNLLIDRSHFIVSLRKCQNCQQKYLFVFTETVDWVGGEDPQYRTILPLTEDEADILLQTDAAGIEQKLKSLAPTRRSFRRDFPSDSSPFVYWSQGIHHLYHN